MRCLVTGGAGFIGSSIARRLLAEGHTVHIVDNLSTGKASNIPPAALFDNLDLNAPELRDVVALAKPEVIFHQAAQVNVRKSVEDPAFDARQNVLGSINLLEAARAAGAGKIIYASSGGACYGEPARLPAAEETPVNPLCPYGASKYCVEKYIELYGRLHGQRYTILRYANVYGPGQDPHGEAGVVAIFCETLLQGKQPRIFGDGAKTRDYVYIDDVVQANVLAMTAGGSRAYNVGSSVRTTDTQVFEATRDATGARIDAKYEDFRPGEVQHICLDYSLINRELGWSPTVEFREGVRRAAAFYRAKLGLAPGAQP